MKTVLMLMIGLHAATFCLAQSEFRAGFIITDQKDTVKGFVNFRQGTKAFERCDFRKTLDEPVVSYEPKQIAGYGFVSDKCFVRRELKSEDGNRLVFFEVLVKGLVSLYKMERSYFMEKGDAFYELSNENKEVVDRGKAIVRKGQGHVAVMNIFMFDCVAIRPEIPRTTLNEQSLTRLVETYNRCMGQPGITYKAKKPWARAVVGFGAGANLSSILFSSTTSATDHLKGSFDNSVSPLVGVSLDIIPTRINERISFQSGLLYLKSHYFSQTVYTTGISTITNKVSIDLQQLKIPLGLRYTFPKGRWMPFFSVGMSNTFQLNSSSDWIQEVQTSTLVTTYRDKAFEMKNYQIGFWSGLGVMKSVSEKLNGFVEFRFEQTDGVNDHDVNPSITSTIKNFQITLGIRGK